MGKRAHCSWGLSSSLMRTWSLGCSGRAVTVHINTVFEPFCKERLHSWKEDGILFIFKASFFTSASHALDYPFWLEIVTLCKAVWFWDQYTWTWVSNSIRPSVRCPSAIGLKSYMTTFCFVFAHMDVCNHIHMYVVHVYAGVCSNGGLRLTPVSSLIVLHWSEAVPLILLRSHWFWLVQLVSLLGWFLTPAWLLHRHFIHRATVPAFFETT